MEEEDKVYTWETEYERTWEAIREDAEGHLQALGDDEAYKAKRRKLFDRPSSVRLGMMRHVFVILDASRAMEDKDLKPDRMNCTLKVIETFVTEFFDQNPISQNCLSAHARLPRLNVEPSAVCMLGLIVTRNGKAEKLTDLNGNPRVHLKALQGVQTLGEPSLQNSLEMAARALRHAPSHASKEAIVVMAALTSCDPGNIFVTLEELSRQAVRCSVVGLAAEVKLCTTISQKCQGTYNVVLDEPHFRDLMLQHCRPPPAKANSESTLIKMGFPKHHMTGPMAACLCHLDQRSPEHISSDGYFCPQCSSKYCELPVECRVCSLTLVLAPHLARSYHHLFPLHSFEEQSLSQSEASVTCTGCQIDLRDKVYSCPECKQQFCIDCDLYVHETLHNCPGCANSIATLNTTA